MSHRKMFALLSLALVAVIAACCGSSPTTKQSKDEAIELGNNISDLGPRWPVYIAQGAGEEAVVGGSSSPVSFVTLSAEKASGPIFAGGGPSVLVRIRARYNGEGVATITVPPIIIKKAGGASWRTTEDVRRDLPRLCLGIWKRADTVSFETEPTMTVLDHETVSCAFSAQPITLSRGFDVELCVTVHVVQFPGISTLQAGMELGRHNVAQGSARGSTPAVIGPTCLILEK